MSVIVKAFWLIISGVGLIVLHISVKYLYLTIKERRHPRFRLDDGQEKVSPLMADKDSKPPDIREDLDKRSKPLSLSEIEAIVNKINFNDYE